MTSLTYQEEIDTLKAACTAITDTFRKSLQPGKDDEGNPHVSIDGKELLLVDENTLAKYFSEIEYAVNNTSLHNPLPYDEYTLDLNHLLFVDEVRFYGRKIRDVNFSGSVFQWGGIFTNANFHSADFSKTKFINGHCIFSNTKFKEYVTFNKAQLPHASFDGAEFKCHTVDFGCAIISKGASFKKAVFEGWTNFKNTDIFGDASFSGCQFQIVDFSETKFKGKANFNNVQFLDRVIYHQTTFYKAPWFHQVNLHQDTSFYNCIFSSFESVDDWRAYRTLKLLMGQFRAHEEEGRFFEYEQRTRSNILLAENYFSLVGSLSKLYDVLSKYGESISRPIVWLFFNTAYFGLLYFLKGGVRANPNIGHKWPDDILPSIGLSLQNAFNPLSLFNKVPTYLVDNVLIALLSATQSLITLILVTLFLLAIRRRFHKSGGQ